MHSDWRVGFDSEKIKGRSVFIPTSLKTAGVNELPAVEVPEMYSDLFKLFAFGNFKANLCFCLKWLNMCIDVISNRSKHLATRKSVLNVAFM